MASLEQAKATLLRALDQLEQAESDLDSSAEACELVVVYSMGHDDESAWQEIGGWAATPGPKWMHAALLRRAADAQDDAAMVVDDEPEDEDEDGE